MIARIESPIRAADRKHRDADLVTQRIVGAADHHAAERRVLRAPRRDATEPSVRSPHTTQRE